MSEGLGIDRSGNDNNWTVTNLTITDQVLDSPTNNFCTLNPLAKLADKLLLQGNLRLDHDTGGQEGGARGTMEMFDGSYHEVLSFGPGASARYPKVGIISVNHGEGNSQIYHNAGATIMSDGSASSAAAIHGTNPGLSLNGTPTTPSYASGDIIGVAYKNGKVYFAKNNVWMNSGDLAAETGHVFNVASGYKITALTHVYDADYAVNFGQDSSFAGAKTAQGNQDGNDIGDFYYEPPSGFLAICTANLPDVAVKPGNNFKTVIWTGNDTAQTITGVGFQPDFIWEKKRVGNTEQFQITDAIQGITKYLFTTLTNEVNTATDKITALTSDGYAIGASNGYNNQDDLFVAWNLKAGSATVTNTAGNEDTQVNANPDAGFSIVKWTNDGNEVGTRGHGLSVAPELIITKLISGYSAGWGTYHVDVGNDKAMRLDLSNAEGPSDAWNDTTPTSTVFSVGTPPQFGDDSSSNPMIAYCFHSVDGFSKVGSYTGNGLVSGSFVYTGFRPAFVLLKRSTDTSGWVIFDNKRDISNPVGRVVYANDTAVESDIRPRADFLSNGFKLRSATEPNWDAGNPILFLAFAETPFKYANAR